MNISNTPKTYPTAEHFARARADIARRRAQLDAELAELDACESTATGIAERYPEDAGPAAAKSIAKAKRPNTGRKQRKPEKADAPAPDQDGEARRFDESLPQRMEEFAAVADIEPSSSGNSPIAEPTAAPEAVRPPDLADALKSANLRELAEADGRRARLPPAKPGISVTGKLMDNGPGDQRTYDTAAFASRRPY